MKQYQLTLTETQLGVLQHALDMYLRVGMGQLREVAEHVIPPMKDSSAWCMRRDVVMHLLQVARRAAMPDLPSDHSYYSINSTEIDESNRVACDVYDVIRHCRAWEMKPEGGFGVAWDKPAHRSREPLPTLRQVTKLQPAEQGAHD